MGHAYSTILFQRALKALEAQNLAQAKALCEKLHKQDPKAVNTFILRGRIALAHGDAELATPYFRKCTSLRPRDPRGHLLLAETLAFGGRYREAVAGYDRVLGLCPQNPGAIAGKAEVLEKRGDLEKARALLAPFLDAGRETAQMAVIQGRLDLHEQRHESIIELAERHLAAGTMPPESRCHLQFLRGKALERIGRYDEAFDVYRSGNECVAVPFSAEECIRQTQQLIETFSAQRLAALPRATNDSELPIFVIGMPRSGSTLIESVLDAHPRMHGAGELPAMQQIVNTMTIQIDSTLSYPACIEDLVQEDVDTLAGGYLQRLARLDPNAKRIVDKALFNYRHLGLIALLFPRAHVIHCHRDPLDTCVSCYMEPLPPALHPYASDLAALGAVYAQYERLMAHWRRTLEISMLDLGYETLVADQEAVSRQIIDFCGLPWDARCLRYYERGRIAHTASYDQVNRPIYSSSVGRHRRFLKHLEPLVNVLAEQRRQQTTTISGHESQRGLDD